MKTRTKIILVIVVLLIIGIAYYLLIYKSSQLARSGTSGTNGGGNNSTPSSTVTPVNVGENAYLRTDVGNPAGNGTYDGIPVYIQPIADSPGTYLEGISHSDWTSGNSIGKVVQKQNGWIKVSLNNYQIWKYFVSPTILTPPDVTIPKTVQGYTGVIRKLTGDYWFSENHLTTFNI